MPHAVAALGAAALTAAGSVWYLPALADLRAGADRPESRRVAAAACLTGWAGVGSLAVLLLAAEGWRVPGAAAVVGAAATAVLRLDAAVRRRREVRETARGWARLGHAPSPAAPGPARHAVAAVVGAGVVVSVVLAASYVVAGWTSGGFWAAAAAPGVVTGLSLIAAVVYGRMTRRPATAVGSGGQRHQRRVGGPGAGHGRGGVS
ncbi:hypothetical protein GCM10010503_56630 [Streptomyces lucensis JCM 4490]|uniref:Uncharacterized protein n=1 Tax=Streptomyces lucensis JCM 4490 TaxID=1306176 RepID=A0A918MU74_9ACTN|nr:hypothetical protein [Streptomyces lucensis]GGW71947.1 hypothetical protein GCM10010503_56630 [Streptomyces lucensis JCM 4490]